MWETILACLPAIICALVGIGLLVAEVFMPGFGVAGFSGIVLEIAAVVLMYIRTKSFMASSVLFLVALSVTAVALSCSLRSATKGRLSRSGMILTSAETSENGYLASDDMQVFLEKEGTVITALRPTGIAEFDGVRLNVLSEGEFIRPDTAVKVIRVEGSKLFVRPV